MSSQISPPRSRSALKGEAGMDQGSAKHQSVSLPVEVWTLVADQMSTWQWARASCTCLSMAAVLPRRITLMEAKRRHLKWMATHWGEAESIRLETARYVMRSKLSKYVGEFGELKVQYLDIHGSRMLGLGSKDTSSSDEDSSRAFDPARFFDEPHYHLWVMEILAHAPKLSVLRLGGINLRALMIATHLKHLFLLIRQYDGWSQEEWHCLQNLVSLETLALEHHEQDWAHQVPEIDVMACTKLRAMSLCQLSPAALCVPEGCTIFIEGRISEIHEQWPMAATSSACSFHYNFETDDRHPPADLSKSLECLATVDCHNLTSLRLEYKKLCSRDKPIIIGSCLRRLQHLTILSGSVYVCFTTPVALQTFVVHAEDCIGLSVRHAGAFTVDSMVTSLTRVCFRWRYCCPETYALLGLLDLPVKRVHQDTDQCCASTPGFSVNALSCRCGTCYECLKCKDVFCGYTYW